MDDLRQTISRLLEMAEELEEQNASLRADRDRWKYMARKHEHRAKASHKEVMRGVRRDNRRVHPNT